MSRKRSVPAPPESVQIEDSGPVSLRGVKYADSGNLAIMVSFEKRKKAALPYVSWESSLSESDLALAMNISYPREPDSYHGQIFTNAHFRNQCLAQVSKGLTHSGLAKALQMKKSDMASFFTKPKTVRVSNHALTQPFYSWNMDLTLLFETANIRVRGSLQDACRHLVALDKHSRVRFTQVGAGLVGVNPRLTAWRSWLDFQQRDDVVRHDYLMTLPHFAWLSLQADLLFDAYILGGTVAVEHDQRRVLYAQREGEGWFVDVWRDEPNLAAAVLLMS
ncbi:hypothetical protein GF380_00040 [Candidatus Uhrbacteria bacterium]|nr:hypothetical protein [Candidatus Uhrbacteria bacterium]MBD3283814.1 hypothetical protein [Candidatus Uhrbacteria bacterium]